MRNLFDPAAYDIPETGVTFSCDNAALQAVFDDCEQLLKQNVQDFGGRKVLIEGAAYRNVWLETQPMGGEMYAKRDAAVAMQNVLVFLQYQRRDGRYPGMLTWSEPTGLAAHYDWMQGFYLARQAYRLADWIGGDRAYLMLLSSSLADFYAYLMAYRTGNPDGIPESWCVWDTGEDNCSRFLRYGAKDGYWAGEKPPVGVLPTARFAAGGKRDTRAVAGSDDGPDERFSGTCRHPGERGRFFINFVCVPAG